MWRQGLSKWKPAQYFGAIYKMVNGFEVACFVYIKSAHKWHNMIDYVSTSFYWLSCGEELSICTR